MKIVEACGTTEGGGLRIATNGINDAVVIGAPEHFFYTPLGVSAPSKAAATNIDTFNAWVLSNGGVYLGKHEVTSNGAEKGIYENSFHNLRARTTSATKVLQLSAPLCPCTSAELEKIDGRNGLIWELTSTGILRGRVEAIDNIRGFAVYIEKNLNTIGTTDTPIENTILDVIYKDPKGDQANPFAVPIDWSFQDIDQPYGVDAVVSNGASNGTNTTFDLTLTKDCSTEVLTGAVQANFIVRDANGTEIPTFTVSETNGVYSFDVTTGESTVYVESNGIIQVVGLLYNMDLTSVATA